MSQKQKPTPYTKQTFISLFNSIARHKHRYAVFSDFVTMSAIALHNAVCMTESLEKEYLEIVGKYKKEEVDSFCKLLANFIELLEAEPADVLGNLYMELELGNQNNGQFFTPHEISILMARLTYGDVLKNMDKPFVTVSEPACGAGGMVLAFASEMLKNGLNPKDRLFVQCIDVDRLAGLMCYLQLSLWHIPAEVIIGNTLTMQFREVYYTPAYYLEGWELRLKLRRLLEFMSEDDPLKDAIKVDIIDLPNQPIADQTIIITAEPEIFQTKTKPQQNKYQKPKDSGSQIDLFDFEIDH